MTVGTRLAQIGALVAAGSLAACSESADAPPDIHYGSSVCAECNMIISDERFATATVIQDDRDRPVPLLFDDFNCQIEHEANLEAPTILARWVHDHATHQWIHAEDAHYVHAMKLHTPMASHIAAFTHDGDAQRLANDLGGTRPTFESVWFGDPTLMPDDARPEQESEGGPRSP